MKENSNLIYRKPRYRVFISYSHSDIQIAECIANILKDNGFLPLWDQKFIWGLNFHEQIERFISHAHIFMPLISQKSKAKGWVQQEIGYALALNIPVLPVSLDANPEAMLYGIHALSLPGRFDGDNFIQEKNDKEKLKEYLGQKILERLIQKESRHKSPVYTVAPTHQERTQMLADYARQITDFEETAPLYQLGGLSSFQIPDAPAEDPIWLERYNNKSNNRIIFELLRQERIILEQHTRDKGCTLLLNYHGFVRKKKKSCLLCRLKTMLEFLNKRELQDKIDIAVMDKNEGASWHNLTILDDWFSAESMSPPRSEKRGYGNTIFSRDLSVIMDQRRWFEAKFQKYSNGKNKKLRLEQFRKMLKEKIQELLKG